MHFAERGARRQHVIDDQHALARAHLKATTQGALAGVIGVVFDEEAAHAKLAGHFIGQNDAAGRRPDDDLDVGRTIVIGQGAAKLFGLLRPLQDLELFPIGRAVAARGQQKMPVQHGACRAKNLLNCVFVQVVHRERFPGVLVCIPHATTDALRFLQAKEGSGDLLLERCLKGERSSVFCARGAIRRFRAEW